MKRIGLRAHGFIDYTVGILFIALPVLSNFVTNISATIAFEAAGIFILLYSIITDYPLGVFRVMPINAHRFLDFTTGLFLCISPWLLNFAEKTWAIHVALGVFVTMVSVCTNPKQFYLLRYKKRKLHKPIYKTFPIR